MPQVTIIGEIIGGTDFDDKTLQCEFKFVTEGNKWTCLKGNTSGTTWVSEKSMENGMSVWNHPIQVQYSCSAMHGWPKLRVQVNKIDEEDRKDLAGYGFCHVPMSPGERTIEIATCRPKGDFWTHVSASFVGGFPRYKNPDIIARAVSKSPAHNVITTGIVHVKLAVTTTNLIKKGVVLGGSPAPALKQST